MTVNRSIEVRAIRRGEMISVLRWQSHGRMIYGHRNETLSLKVALDRKARAFADLDRENAA